MEFEDLPEDGQELVRTLHIEHDDEKRLEGWGDVARRFPSYLPGRLNFASALLKSGDTAASRGECQKLLDEFGADPRISGQLSLVELAEENHEKALQLADGALEEGYHWPPLLEVRGRSLLGLGRHQEAQAALLGAYRASPHSWSCLELYCEMSGRSFVSPMDSPSSPIDPLTRMWLYQFIDREAHTPADGGNPPGCNHTLRFVDRWCEVVGQDPIPLYQFLNGNGGFCDCEVIFNTEPNDAQFSRLAVIGGLLGNSAPFLDAVRKSRIGQEVHEVPPLILDESVSEDYEDELRPILLEQKRVNRLSSWFGGQPRDVKIWPQILAGRQFGALAEVAFMSAEPGAQFWAVVVAPDDDRSCRLWTSDHGAFEVRGFDDDYPPDAPHELREIALAARSELLETLPKPPPSKWVKPFCLPPVRPECPRLLFFGAEFEQMCSYADGSGLGPIGVEDGFHFSPSPDGRFLAWVELGRGRESLVVGDLSTGERRRLMRAEHFDEHVLWVGPELLYLTTEGGGILLSATGEPTARLDLHGRPSRDGSHLAAGTEDGLVVTDRTGSVIRRLDGRGHIWDWSPDGTLVVFTKVEGVGHRVYLWDLEKDSARPLHSDEMTCYWPAFTSDGRAVVCDHSSEPRGSGPSRVARLSLAGDSLEIVTSGPHDERPRVHPTSPWIAWQRRDPNNRQRTTIFTLGPDGEECEIQVPGSEVTWMPT